MVQVSDGDGGQMRLQSCEVQGRVRMRRDVLREEGAQGMKLLIDIPEHIYEHAKETTEDSRDEFDAMRAIANGTQQESSSEIPNTCGDAISRQAVLDAMYELCSTGETLKENPWRDNPHIDAITDAIENLPSSTPQQRTGEWIEHFDEIGKWYECDQCHTDWGGPVNYCPNCGCAMKRWR